MESLVLTEATFQDVDRIMEMEIEGFAPGNRELREVYETRIKVFPQGSLIAHLGAEHVGCAFSEIWKKYPIPTIEHFKLGHDILDQHDPVLGTELYISSMTINPTFRGKGLGSQLLIGSINHVIKVFPQLTSALLLVNENWGQARKIYDAAGFEEVAQFPQFFNPHGTTYENGIVMRSLFP